MKAHNIVFYSLAVIALLVIAIFSLLYRVDANPLCIWDEARVAVSALEMSQSHNYFIPTYDGSPDMWSVKPPLMVIVQSFSMKLFGYNELGARMPSVIAAFATLGLLFWFCIRILKNFIAGFCVVLFLCTSSGYVCEHVARSGDYDTLLIFFLTAYFIFALTFILTKRYKLYLLFNVFLLLAVFTKGIGGVFFLPGIFLVFITEKNMLRELFSPKFILPPAIVFICFIAYYLIRETYNTGYIHTVIFEEMQGRLFDSRFDTNNTWYYFFESMVSSTFNPWWILIPLSIPVYFNVDTTERKVILGTFFTLIIFWIPLTISINKNFWYNAPAIPLLSLLAALTFSKIILFLIQKIDSRLFQKAVIVVTICLLSIMPCRTIFNNSSKLNEHIGFAELIKSNRIKSGTKIISKGYNSPILFYQKAMMIRGTTVLVNEMDAVKEGDTVIVLSLFDINEMKQHYQCEVLFAMKETEMLYLKSKI